jgi:serine/threonine protein phosphatase PrpC
MEIFYSVFSYSKNGNCPEDNEDAFECSKEGGRFAIADGATQSTFTKEWVQYLVKHFIKVPIPTNVTLDVVDSLIIQEWLAPVRHEWHASIDWESLPWWAENKARTVGALSTLLGLQIITLEAESNHFLWQALACGDSNLFVLREGNLLTAFPLRKSDEFNNSPALLSSYQEATQPSVIKSQGLLTRDDVIFLCTDALAKWFLSELEAGQKPWEYLLALSTQNSFQQMIDHLRATGTIHNDDTTLVTISLNSETILTPRIFPENIVFEKTASAEGNQCLPTQSHRIGRFRTNIKWRFSIPKWPFRTKNSK